MADQASILAQSAPSAGVLTDAYTVPAGKVYAVISTVSIANTSATTLDSYRVSVAKGGAANDIKQYLVYDAEVDANGSAFLTLGITLGLGDVLRVRSAVGNLSFNVFGVEVS